MICTIQKAVHNFSNVCMKKQLMKKAQSAPYARNGGTYCFIIEYAEQEGQLNDEITPDQETHISIADEATEAPLNYAIKDSNS